MSDESPQTTLKSLALQTLCYLEVYQGKTGVYQRSVPYLGISPSPRKNIYGAPMMCKNLPAHQGSFLPSCQMDKKKETKTLKHQATLKASGAITQVRVISHSAENSPTPCFHLLRTAVPSLPSLHLCIHCSKVSPPCNLIHFTKYLPSLLYFKVSELLTPTFCN